MSQIGVEEASAIVGGVLGPAGSKDEFTQLVFICLKVD
jgi:hypothetical protein